MAISIIIVDDHQVVRRGLRYFLQTQEDISIVAEGANGKEALALAGDYKPDVVLMDLEMPVMNGVEATRKMTAAFPEVRILILSSFSDQDHVIPALQAGASGFQLKDIDPETLADTIRAVHSGESKLHDKVMKYVLTRISGKHTEEELRYQRLTEREKEILTEITNGRSNKEIAHVLHISEKTVKTHVSNVLGKLELADRTQAAVFALKVQGRT